jgi:hypothetical protein
LFRHQRNWSVCGTQIAGTKHNDSRARKPPRISGRRLRYQPAAAIIWLAQQSIPGGDRMKTYVITTGVVFGVLALLHLWRAIAEGPQLASDPWFLVITVIAAALSLWAFRLVWLSSRRQA